MAVAAGFTLLASVVAATVIRARLPGPVVPAEPAAASELARH
jgi:hypothetical protein